MSKRYRITREFQTRDEAEKPITLEACKAYFASKPDFEYTTVYTVKGETTVSIPGDFFLWHTGAATIPFRHYQGDIYVSGSNDAVIPKLMEVASELEADVSEG